MKRLAAFLALASLDETGTGHRIGLGWALLASAVFFLLRARS